MPYAKTIRNTFVKESVLKIFFLLDFGCPSCISNINCQTRKTVILWRTWNIQTFFRRRRCLKRLANETVHIFSRKQIRASQIYFFSRKQIGSRKQEKSPTFNCSLCNAYADRIWIESVACVTSTQNNICMLLSHIWMSLWKYQGWFPIYHFFVIESWFYRILH